MRKCISCAAEFITLKNDSENMRAKFCPFCGSSLNDYDGINFILSYWRTIPANDDDKQDIAYKFGIDADSFQEIVDLSNFPYQCDKHIKALSAMVDLLPDSITIIRDDNDVSFVSDMVDDEGEYAYQRWIVEFFKKQIWTYIPNGIWQLGMAPDD